MSSNPTVPHEARVTMRVIVTGEAPAGQATMASKSAVGALRHTVLLLLSLAGALIPFVAPLELMNAIPRAIVVAWYGLLGLAAGLCGIVWIIRAARLPVNAQNEVDIPLVGEAQERILEALSSRGTQR